MQMQGQCTEEPATAAFDTQLPLIYSCLDQCHTISSGTVIAGTSKLWHHLIVPFRLPFLAGSVRYSTLAKGAAAHDGNARLLLGIYIVCIRPPG